MSWGEGEFRGIDLGDKRRDRRAIRLLERLAERPTTSIPGVCSGLPETQATWAPQPTGCWAPNTTALPYGGRLWTKVLGSPPLGEVRFPLPAGRGRIAREVRQGLYAQLSTSQD